MLRLLHQKANKDWILYAIKGNTTTKKNVFKGVTTSKDLAAVFSEQVFEVETKELFAQEFAGRLKDILNHMEHNGGMAADNVFAGAPIRTQTGGMTHLQR
jgi:hypothetical protein